MKRISIKSIIDIKLIITIILFSSFILTPSINAYNNPTILLNNNGETIHSDCITRLGNSIYKLLIIAPEQFIKDLNPLVTYKIS